MTTEQRARYDKAFVNAIDGHNTFELARAFIRYEALRKLNARQFAELSKRNLAGEPFDDLVDGLISGAIQPFCVTADKGAVK